MKKPRKKLSKPKTRTYHNLKVPVTLHKLDWLEWLKIAACIFLLLYPKPYIEIFTIVLLLPIFGLLINVISRPILASLVSISSKHKSGYDLADFIEFPGFFLVIVVIRDYEFESFFSLLKVGTVGFVLMLILIRLVYKAVEDTNKDKGLIYFVVISNIALYSFAATYGINCVYDNAIPKVYETTVIEKHTLKGRRSTSWYFKIKPWGNHLEAEDISVDQWKYDRTSAGDKISIDYREGLLGIPWYNVSK